MAVYHLAVKVVSRARGQRVLAVAAARSGTALRDEYYGTTHRPALPVGVVHAEILAPSPAPAWALDREALWNRVESAERRKDAQLARDVEIGLPIELSLADGVSLLREYALDQYVSRGMIADLSITRSVPHNPRGHVLLTLRRLTADGFGAKERRWNGKSLLHAWRAAWAHHANEHLLRAGHGVRIDHRTLEAQQVELIASRRVGVGRMREDAPPRAGAAVLPHHLLERAEEQRRIARENGACIIEDPTVALRALAHSRPRFTAADLEAFLRSRTDGEVQFEAAHRRVMQSPELVELVELAALDGGAASGNAAAPRRFTTRDLLEADRSLTRRALSMWQRQGHRVEPGAGGDAVPGYAGLVDGGDIHTLDGRVGALRSCAGKTLDSVLLAARHAWDTAGLRVTGTALSERAASALRAGIGIPARTLEEVENDWEQGREALTRDDVLVVGDAELIGLKPLERLLGVADKARAKLVLCGDLDALPDGGRDCPLHAVIGALRSGR